MRWVAGFALILSVSSSACAQEKDIKSESGIQNSVSKNQISVSNQNVLDDYYKSFEERYLRVTVAEGYFDHNYDVEPLEDGIHIGHDNRHFLRQAFVNELPDRLECHGVAMQGGLAICQTDPNAKVDIGRSETDVYTQTADDNGRIIVGFDRDEPPSFIRVGEARIDLDFTPREYSISRIDGLPPSQVSTFTPEQLKHIKASSARKKVGFSSRAKDMGFADGFIYPLKEFKKTSPFGAQRILNGEAKRPHYGVDIAARVGTPIYAPADGIVSLADDDLYFEGAMVLLDHGQGLISMYLHTDSIVVEPGQAVRRGEQIATVGSKGRSTGPHLCWRLKWRNRNLDPELLTEWPDKDG